MAHSPRSNSRQPRLCGFGSLEEINLPIRDRRHLSERRRGRAHRYVDKHNGRLNSQPEIVTRGFLPGDDDDQGIIAGGARRSCAEDNSKFQRGRKNPIGR